MEKLCLTKGSQGMLAGPPGIGPGLRESGHSPGVIGTVWNGPKNNIDACQKGNVNTQHPKGHTTAPSADTHR